MLGRICGFKRILPGLHSGVMGVPSARCVEGLYGGDRMFSSSVFMNWFQ